MSLDPNVSLPFSFSPSQSWDGNAGSWSTFIIRIGTPPQDFKTLPSTSDYQTWVPVPAGCILTDPSNCGSLRGALPFHGASSNGFQSNQSSTWEENGLYNLAIETHLNLTGNGDYGYDTVGLEVENSGGLTLEHQVVGGLATKEFYLGQFGLGPKPSNFTTFTDPVPSYMRTLVDENLIPSLSYGYTAGAKYRLNGVLGSLTLGGYDASRFTPSNMTIPFDPDDSRSLTIGVQSIAATETLQGSVEPLSTGAFFLIDSSVPDLWVPEASYQLFEQAFGLTYDPITDLYLVNDTVHNRLVQLNPSITIKVGNSDFDGQSVDITLPYGAFDLQASSPLYPSATNYFPLRRATNSTQYTLGRTFLQEAYLIVDSERSNFSVNQAVFLNPNPEKIIPIHSTNYTSSDNSSTIPHGSHNLDNGAIAGIAAGVIAILATLVAIAFVIFCGGCIIRRRLHVRHSRPTKLDSLEQEDKGQRIVWIPELASKEEQQAPQELSSSLVRPRQELRGSPEASELHGQEFPSLDSIQHKIDTRLK